MHRAQQLSAQAAARGPGLARTHFYRLYSDYLQACAQALAEIWSPGLSGGDHHPDWPADVTALLTKLLASQPPASYSAAASELHRRLNFKTDRASIRRWAIEHPLNPDTRCKPTRKPVKRWQARDYVALWQYDATPHAWWPGNPDKQVLLDILDDATRLNTGARLYPSEPLLAHLDFLPRVFQAYGLPLVLYVDDHSFFYTHNPDAFTQRGQALHCYGVQLLDAPTLQAKGKIERRHDYWQKRRVPRLAAEDIRELCEANRRLDQLLPHANRHEVHRELGQTPRQAQQQALAENRSVLRPPPPAPGGPSCGANKPASVSAMTATSPALRIATSLTPTPVLPSSAAYAPTGTSTTSAMPPNSDAKPVVLLHCPVF